MGARRRGVVSVLAGLLLVAVLVPVGAGAQSSGDGSVSGVRVWSDSPGVLRVAWSAPDPVASDFRVRWAPVGEGFRSWSDLSGNAFPVSESLSIEGLDADLVYRVQVRARYYDGRGVRLWSGAWSDVVSGAASGGDVAGTVLAGSMTWGASVSGGSAFVGFSGAQRSGDPDRVGGFEMRFWDGAVVRSRTHLYALAQIAGSVGAGPASGLADPVILTMTTDVDLSSGFMVEVGDCLLDSADAVNPSGDAGRFRYWMWDSPCETWLPGEQAEFRIITADDTDGSGRGDASVGSLGISGVTLDSGFDPEVRSYTAVAQSGVGSVTVHVVSLDPDVRQVRVTPADSDPDVGGHQVDLNSDGTPTVVTVKVTASDKRTTRSYSVTVTRSLPRADPLSDDAVLAGLSLSDGELSPAFDTATTAYSASVPASTGWVTVTAEARFEGALVDITPPDANLLQAGHQVDLAASPDGAADGSTDIDVTVTAEDQTTGTYRVTVTRPPATSFRSAARVINTTSMGLGWIKSLWSDGRTLFVANVHYPFHLPGDIYKIDIATGERAGRLMLIERNEGLPFSRYITNYSTDVWSDGESMWVLDRWGAVARHDLVDGEDYVLVQSQEEIEVAFDSVAEFRPPGLLHSTRTDPPSYSFGIWSDGEIMWVSNAGEHTTKVRAFNLATGEPVPDRNIAIQVPADPHINWGNHGVQDIWSDGTTMWVVYRTPRLARAYDLDTGDRRSHLDIDIADVDGRIGNPRGIWSDSGMMWFSSFYIPPNSHPLISTGNPPSRIFGFYLPTEAALASLSVGDADIGSFSPWDTSYTATVADTTETVTVEAAAQHDDATVVILPADADPDADGHQVSLNPGDNTITVTAGTYNHTMTYTVTVTR